MKPDAESWPLLRRLHERVFADSGVRSALDDGFARLAAELATRTEPPHATCIIPIGLFVDEADNDEVRLCRLFLLRRGARMAAPERHLNSVQRLASYRGSGAIHQGVPGGGPERLRPRAIVSPDATRRVGDDGAARAELARHGGSAVESTEPAGTGGPAAATDLARHWDIVPAGVWHFPEAGPDADWATVTFHSAAEDEIVDELGRYAIL